MNFGNEKSSSVSEIVHRVNGRGGIAGNEAEITMELWVVK
jgi:hypothetical protein